MSSFDSLTQVTRVKIDPDYEVIRDDLRSELENGVLPYCKSILQFVPKLIRVE